MDLHMTILATKIAADDVGGPVSVAGNDSTTAGAGEHPPPWCPVVKALTHATGARAVLFADVLRRDTVLAGLVLDIADKLAVRPLAHPLIVVAAFVDTVGH